MPMLTRALSSTGPDSRTKPAMTNARVEVCPKSLAREYMSPSRSKGAAYHTLSNLEDYAETDCSFHLRARVVEGGAKATKGLAPKWHEGITF